MSVKTAIVYHSGYGHTEVVAKAVARGAGEKGAAQLIPISAEGKITDAEWAALKDADAIIFGAPTYMGAASAQFKIFADASSKPWFTQEWKNKVSGGFTNSHSLSGDKLATLKQFSILAAQHGMIWVSLGEPAAQQEGEAHQRGGHQVNRLGSFLGVMTQAENVAPEGSIPEGDLKTAEIYGARVAGIAAKLAA
ncbi:MAG: NADPH-dependent FMN reductase [Micavibrio aeruginosavorus]|uniref:NADPH-dependent FMN reductase n=1 Tax=Micavibrio aeruginosavorus TaxID=349221 RepID=A0A2W5HQ90_9BACT|nr:MAG: NADPH-dependent FMN reductase [Micavibrio aeruginosavorus]